MAYGNKYAECYIIAIPDYDTQCDHTTIIQPQHCKQWKQTLLTITLKKTY